MLGGTNEPQSSVYHCKSQSGPRRWRSWHRSQQRARWFCIPQWGGLLLRMGMPCRPHCSLLSLRSWWSFHRQWQKALGSGCPWSSLASQNPKQQEDPSKRSYSGADWSTPQPCQSMAWPSRLALVHHGTVWMILPDCNQLLPNHNL